MTIEVGFASVDDIDDLAAMAQEFIEESDWPVTFDAAATKLRLDGTVESDYAEVLVVRDGRKILGGAIVAIDRDFTNEWFGYLVKFYIRKDHRRADVALPLARFCVRWFDNRRCKLAFATATAGLAGGFEIMMKRIGFAPCGDTFVKEFPADE